MTSPITDVTGISSSSSTDNTSSPPPAQATGEVTALTKVSSLADLKNKAPKVYKAMVLGVGIGMINQMQDNQRRLKEMWDDMIHDS